MNQQLLDQDPLMQAMKDYYDKRDVVAALRKIDIYISSNPRQIPFPYQFKSDMLLNDFGKIDDALNTLNIGLEIFPESHDLLKRRAEILGFYKGNLNGALQDIGRALIFFETSSNNQLDFLNNITGSDKIQFLKNYAASRVDLKGIQEQLNRLNSINIIKAEVNDIKNKLESRLKEAEDKIEKERIRSIELLGIFTAILGFIFATIQKMPVADGYADLLLFGLSLTIPLILFVLLIRLLFSNK